MLRRHRETDRLSCVFCTASQISHLQRSAHEPGDLSHADCLSFLVLTSVLCSLETCPGIADDAFVPIQKVHIGPNRQFLVNGKPFFPIMGWLQDAQNLPKLKAVGMNSIAGYWRPKDAGKSRVKIEGHTVTEIEVGNNPRFAGQSDWVSNGCSPRFMICWPCAG